MVPVVRIDNEVYAWLQGSARPFEDTPNSVLRRIAKLDEVPLVENQMTIERNSRAPIAYGVKTPQYAYRKPILATMKKLGGEADRMTVFKEIETIMKGQLTDSDKSDIKSGAVRWQKTVEWEIKVMRDEQLLKPVSETRRGVWALTAKGAEAAAYV